MPRTEASPTICKVQITVGADVFGGSKSAVFTGYLSADGSFCSVSDGNASRYRDEVGAALDMVRDTFMMVTKRGQSDV